MNAPIRGRDDQIGLIREVLVGAAAGRGATVLVEGRPGFGKTRILDAAADLALGLGIRVGRGAVAARDVTVPLGALFEAMFDGSPPLVDVGERRRLHYLPEQRYWLLDELESLLEQAALRSAVLICLDDMQWAEVGCQVALRTLPTRLATVPIVWLVAYRPGRESAGLRPTIDALVSEGARRCVLGPLDAAATGRVVRDEVMADPDDALLSLARRTHGSPFLLGELLRGLREEGLVSIESGRARLVESRLPARVRDSMRERLARMSPGAAQLARVACVLGRTFSFDQLAVMLDSVPAALLAPVEELLGAELLTQDDGALTFRHDLLRDAVRDSLPATARRALQRQAVTVLLTTGATPVEVASALADSAQRGDRAAVETLRRAVAGLAGSDPGAAANLGLRALELAGAADPARGPLAAQTVLLLHAAGRVGEGRRFAQEVLGEALPPEQEAEVRLSLATMIALPPDARIEAGRRALELPGLTEPVRARHLANLVHNLLVAGRASEAREMLPETRVVVEAGGDPVAAFILATVDSGIDYYTADLALLLGRAERTVALRAGANEPTHAMLAMQWRTELLAALDRHDECERLTAAHLAKAQRDQQGLAVRLWENRRGRQLFQLGRLADAAAALEGSLEPAGQSSQLGVLEVAAVVALGQVALHTGDTALTRRSEEIVRGLDVTAAPGVRRLPWIVRRTKLPLLSMRCVDCPVMSGRISRPSRAAESDSTRQEGAADRVQVGGQRRRVELAVVKYVGGGDQRALHRRVQLADQHLVQRAGGGQGGRGHLRQHPQANGSWVRAGAAYPATSARSSAATSAWPGCARAAWTASSYASGLPRSARKVSGCGALEDLVEGAQQEPDGAVGRVGPVVGAAADRT